MLSTVIRGGSWVNYYAWFCRASRRMNNDTDFPGCETGFRIVFH